MSVDLARIFNDRDALALFFNLAVKTSLKDRGSGGAGFVFDKREDEMFLPIRLDNGLFKHQTGKIADFLIYYKKEGSNLKVVILELKGKIKNRKPEEQIESTIEIIKTNKPFMIPENAKIIKIVKVKSSSPKMSKNKRVPYLSDDHKITKIIKG